MRSAIAAAAIASAAIALTGCTAAQLAGFGGVGALVPSIVQVAAGAVGITPPVLTEAAKIACAAQSAFNTASDLAVSQGSSSGLVDALKTASAVAGNVCTW
jgi:hypothetical protein